MVCTYQLLLRTLILWFVVQRTWVLVLGMPYGTAMQCYQANAHCDSVYAPWESGDVCLADFAPLVAVQISSAVCCYGSMWVRVLELHLYFTVHPSENVKIHM